MPQPVNAAIGLQKPPPLKARPSGKKQDQYDADMKAYNEDQALKNT